MLGKLLKYEFKGLLTPVIIMLCVLFGTTALALITFFSINPTLESTVNGVSVIANDEELVITINLEKILIHNLSMKKLVCWICLFLAVAFVIFAPRFRGIL